MTGPLRADARVAVNVRIGRPALERIEARAKRDHRTRSDTIRLMLAYADHKMPEGWRP